MSDQAKEERAPEETIEEGVAAAPTEDSTGGDYEVVVKLMKENEELKDRLLLKELPDEDRGRYNTLAGMLMLLLGRLPKTADVVEWEGWRFEVVDLDGKRVDKVLATQLPPPPAEPEA